MWEDPGAGGHPLGVAVGDDPSPAVRVLVLEHAIDHVGDGLEPAVGMPWGALRLAGGVLDFAHLVEVDERVEVGEIDAGERPPDREPLPFQPARSHGDAADGSLARCHRIRQRDPGQDGDVVDGDGGHVGALLARACIIARCRCAATTCSRGQGTWRAGASSGGRAPAARLLRLRRHPSPSPACPGIPPAGRTRSSPPAVAQDGTPRPLVPGTQVRLTFGADDAIGVNAGCNTMGGSYRVEGSSLRVDGGAMTEMACDEPRMQQDD
jgi:hypothetical protein